MQPDRLKCGICSRERERDEMYLVSLTTAEKETIRGMGHEPQDEYAYCRPCWGLVSDPEKVSQLYRGMMQVRLRPFGLATAERAGARLYDFLLSKARKKD